MTIIISVDNKNGGLYITRKKYRITICIFFLAVIIYFGNFEKDFKESLKKVI